ncbi:hypothetical protein NSA47_11350 [Irregularibacter muris]|uniref:Uncharacterized protein n=1 Tax=Irregularibacter muris TaxID=1796619 RepID=A0AAE3HHB5_9FIRM|nr:hypothetical protein [Irregularibacter muris]MCR1899572.1 hypothetical protein [Irregularibacter muris]
MNTKERVIESLQKASLEEILDREDIANLDWFWINRDIFGDILKNISGFDYYEQEEEVTELLKSMKDENYIQLLRPEIENKGFIEISQQLFAKLDQDYTIVQEIDTWIFIKESYYNKLWIKKSMELEWVLKAMSIDIYQRFDMPYSSLKETYKELFENNNRVIEEIVETKQYVLDSGKWKLSETETVLTFYKKEKKFYEWSQGEVEFKFDDLQG